MEYIIKVLLRFCLYSSLVFCVRVPPLPPEFNVGPLVPDKKKHPARPSFIEQTHQKVNRFTVDGKYNQSVLTTMELHCGFHGPPYPLSSMLGYSGWVVFFFPGSSVPTLNSGGMGGNPNARNTGTKKDHT